MAGGDTLAFGKTFPSHEDLKGEQNQDTTLSSFFDEAVSEGAIKEVSGYFVKNGVLMWKWTPSDRSWEDDWSSVFQVVVPSIFRLDVLGLSHDQCLVGHSGIKKTLDRVLRHFY